MSVLNLFKRRALGGRVILKGGSVMVRRWNAYCAGVVAFALAGCSGYQNFHDWWTEDLRRPRDDAWAADLALEEESALIYDEQDFRPWEDEDAPPPRVRTPERRTPEPRVTQRETPVRRAPPDIQQSRLPPPATPPRPTPPRALSTAPAVVASLPAPVPVTPPTPRVEREPPPPAEFPILPASFVSAAGMSEARVRAVLGAPTAVSDRGAQKVWRYVGTGCAVEVVFFRDVTRNTYAALDHKTLVGGVVSTTPCLRPPAESPGR